MDFRWTDEQLALMDAARRFSEREITPGALERDERAEFYWEGWRKTAEFRIMGLPIPREYGGGGADCLTTMKALEGFALGCADRGFEASMLAHMVICEVPIWENGTEEQKKRYLPRLCSGEWIGAFGLTEPNAGSDVAGIQTTAIRRGDSYCLNGTKMFITNGPIADCLIIFATVDRTLGAGGIQAFIVERGFPGFSVSRSLDKMGLRSSPTGELVLQDCEVPMENVLGREKEGFRVALGTFEWERAFIGAAGVGGLERLLVQCVKYAKERVQFGRPIAQFQAIQERLADMKVILETSRMLTYRVGWMKQEGLQAMVDASIAKLYFTESAIQFALHAIQIHGGYGYMREFNVERALRDYVLGPIGGGTSEIQRMIIARSLTGM